MVFVPTPNDVVMKMLDLAKVGKSDLVYDLGCGDGRIVVLAAKKRGARGVGYDIDPQRIRECHANAKQQQVEDLVRFAQEDIFKLDLGKATVITLYLLPSLNVRLIPQLEKLKPGVRIVSHDFDMQRRQAGSGGHGPVEGRQRRAHAVPVDHAAEAGEAGGRVGDEGIRG